jgi:hypothetical protein
MLFHLLSALEGDSLIEALEAAIIPAREYNLKYFPTHEWWVSNSEFLIR